ncbi:MAG: exopolyphosphatase [Rhodothermales bacterium]|nr:exopolyphosphatase [Rhodothermales bacterium]
MSELIATIDVGTNTAHLLVSRVMPTGDAEPLHSETRFVRLGQGVDASGEIHPEALARLKSTLLEFSTIAREAGAGTTIVAGTSASRDARDPQGLIEFVRRETGLRYTIVSGEEEAQLTGLGALSVVSRPAGPVVIADIGGGSTELTYVDRTTQPPSVERSVSLDVGSVRITERCFITLPPSREAVARARDIVDEALTASKCRGENDRLFVGAAGTIRALALIEYGVSTWSDLPVGEVTISREICGSWCDRLLGLDEASVRALDPIVMHGRADVFAAGVLILDRIFDRLAARECLVSPRGLRHGLAIRYAQLKKAREG